MSNPGVKCVSCQHFRLTGSCVDPEGKFYGKPITAPCSSIRCKAWALHSRLDVDNSLKTEDDSMPELLLTCDGYKSLEAAVVLSEEKHGDCHDYRGKQQWVLDRVRHYAEKTGVDAHKILNAWEGARDYWFMNFYQDCNQPLLDGTVRVFETQDEVRNSIGDLGFSCPKCKGTSTDAHVCNASEDCDWKSYGLFGTLGEGATIFIKSTMMVHKFFMPVAWSNDKEVINA